MSGRSRILLLGALALVVALNDGCKKNSSSYADSTPSQTHVPSAPARPVSKPLICPPLGTVLVGAPRTKDGHRVILKWKASRRADAKHAQSVGYCIYRGPKRDTPPTELINHLPFPETLPETKCADDSVENGKDYYYVVRAISARGVTSEVSKPPVRARIPDTPVPPFRKSNDSAPLCRESPGVEIP
jgi:hypothetical protein